MRVESREPREGIKKQSEPMKVEGYTGTVYFDGATVRIERKKALARLSAGKGEKVIPVAAITSVQLKPAGAGEGEPAQRGHH